AIATGDLRRLGLVALHTGEYFRQKGSFAEARVRAEQALAMGDKLQDPPLIVYASEYLGLACHALGDYPRASRLLWAAMQFSKAEWRPGIFGGTVLGSWEARQSVLLAWRARCLAECGDFDEGIDAGRRAVALADGLDSPYS